MMATVNDILTQPFSDRPLGEQVRIVVGGRPHPNIHAHIPDKDGNLSSRCNQSIYEEETWLCGCDKRNGMFCWTCMLFVSQRSQWNVSGFYAFKRLREEMKIHKNSENHLNGMLQYQVFLKDNVCSTPADITEQNTYLNKLNREALKRLIDVVCTMVSQITPCTVETIVPELPKRCVKMLKCLKAYDDSDVISEAIRIVETNPGIVTDIIVLIAGIMKKELVKELKLSTFVSVMLSGHRDAKLRKKYSVVVRYMKDGEVYERLVGFSLSVERRLIHIVQQVVTELEISDKFLALSCDGLVAPGKDFYDFFVPLMNIHYPNTFFVPWHLHEFHSVLLQRVSVHPVVDVFLRTLKSLKEHFESSPANCKALHKSTYGVLDLRGLKMTDSQFLRVLKMHRNHFVIFFNSVAHGSSGWCASDDVFTAESYAKKLQDPHFVFVLELFFQLFQCTAYVNEMLTSNSPDCVFEWNVGSSILDALRGQKVRGYGQMWSLFAAEITNNNPKEMQILSTKSEMKMFFFKVFQDVINGLMRAIHLRYRYLKKLTFLGIFDCENRERFDMTRNYFKNFLESRVPFFCYSHLVNEVKILSKHGRLLGRKSVFEMVELFRQKKLDETFKNCYKLAELIITLPCRPIHFENPITKLDNINSWVSCSFSHQAGCLSLLAIENDFFQIPNQIL